MALLVNLYDYRPNIRSGRFFI